MFDIQEQQFGWSGRFGRRQFLRVGAVGALGLTLSHWLEFCAAQETKTQPATRPARAKSVIQLWMAGGPCHIDTFDPKPTSGADYCGPYNKVISTQVREMMLSSTMPQMAQQADKFAILRGMTHPSGGHETATYIMQTGTLPAGELVYPAVGAVVALKKGYGGGYDGSLPPYISIPNPIGRFSECGFLGSAYSPFATGGDPSAADFRVAGVGDAATEKRFENRRTLLEAVDSFAREHEKDEQVQKLTAFEQKAYGLILGKAKMAFDLSQEKDAVRERYGKTKFGQSCLLARRLVENGVPFVTVNSPGWDTHKSHFEKMGQMLPVLDQGFAALLEDLGQRGLLESTIVLWGGEFGRTPKIQKDPPWNGGRHHFSTAFSCVVAGGGFKGGHVVGTTDQRGERVRDRPIYPWDLSASMYKLLGVDPTGHLPHPRGCVAYVTPTSGQSGGMLTEIM